MTESRSGRRTILQVLLKVVTALFSVALIVLIGALLVLAQPKREDTEKAEPQPLLTASPAMNITVETDLRSLVESFPVPVLSFMIPALLPTPGWRAVSAASFPCTGRRRTGIP